MIFLAPFRLLINFWTKPIRAESLALFRILLSLTLLGSLLTGIGRTLTDACGPDGYYPARVNDEWLANQGKLCLLRGPVSLPILGDWLPEGLARDFPWLNKQVSPGAPAPGHNGANNYPAFTCCSACWRRRWRARRWGSPHASRRLPPCS